MYNVYIEVNGKKEIKGYFGTKESALKLVRALKREGFKAGYYQD